MRSNDERLVTELSTRRFTRRTLLRLGMAGAIMAGLSSLVACSPAAAPSAPSGGGEAPAKTGGESKAPAQASGGAVTLDYWHPETREAAVQQEKDTWFKRFQDNNAGVTLKYTVIPWGDLPTKIRAAKATNTLPDMIYTYAANHVTWGLEGVTQPVDDIIDEIGRDKFDEAYLRYVTYDGKAWAVPFIGWNHVLYYRKDWYGEAGLSDIKSWADWKGNVEKINKAPERYGILMYNANNAEVKYIISLLALNNAWLFGKDGKTVEIDSADVKPRAVESFQMYKDLAKFSPPGWQDKGETDQRLAFLKDQGAHLESSTSFADNMRQQMKEDPKVLDKVSAFPLPINSGDRQGWVSFSGFAITATTKNRDMVKKLILDLFQPDDHYIQYIANTVTGWTPVMKFAQESDAYWNAEPVKPFTSFLKAGIATGKTGVMEGQFWGPNKYAGLVQGENVWVDAANMLTLKDEAPDAVVDFVASKTRDIVKGAG